MIIVVLWVDSYQIFANFWAQFLRQHSLCPNRNFEGKIFLSKMKLFMNIVRHWAKMCWFLARNVRHGCQSCILRVEENFWLKIKWFTKISLLIIFSGLWVEIFWAFGEKVWGAFFKKALFMSREKILRKLLCWGPFFFGKVKILSQIFFIIAEKFQKCYPYCILHVQRSFFRFMKIYNSFRFLGNNISAVCLEHFRHGCQNAFPRVWENFLRKINQFEKKVFSYFFCSMSGSVSDFWCIFLRHGFEKYILHVMKKISRRSLRWNYIICWNFWVFFSFFSGFRWKKRNQCCQNCNLRVQMNIFGLETLF